LFLSLEDQNTENYLYGGNLIPMLSD